MVTSPARIVVVSAYGERTSRTSVSLRGRRYSPSIRNGAFSSAEPRSSTKLVRIGAGRASFDRIQPLSTAVAAGSGGAVSAEVDDSVAASASASVTHLEGFIGSPLVIRPV